MTNPHDDDYYNSKNDQRFLQFRASLIGIAVLFAILGFTSLGYLVAKIDKEKEKVITLKKKCNGYVVLDGKRVIWCNGDTVVYDWHWRLKRTAR